MKMTNGVKKKDADVATTAQIVADGNDREHEKTATAKCQSITSKSVPYFILLPTRGHWPGRTTIVKH